MTSQSDIHYMRMALNLARRGLGVVAPNPSVGCVLVKGSMVIAAAHTAKGGRPHAEALALEKAGLQAKGATVYVSLEPCSHQGKTSPCAQALIDADVARVVVACTDPDPRVSGQGIKMLQAVGIEVIEGALECEALALNAGFILRVTQNRPLVTCKLAISADGKIAAEPGDRTQISGELAARYMHLQRSKHDAILVGAETYRVDAPDLTTRLGGFEHEPLRVVLGSVDAPGFIVLKDMDIAGVLADLAGKDITRLLVEGGAKTHKSFLEAGMVDEFQLCKSPITLGEKGVDGLDGKRIEALSGLKHQKTRVLGEDRLEIYGKEA